MNAKTDETARALEALEAATQTVREAVLTMAAQGVGRTPWTGTQSVLVDLAADAVAERTAIAARLPRGQRTTVYMDLPTDLVEFLDVAAMRYGMKRHRLLEQLLRDWVLANPDLKPFKLPLP